jgi:hypothetical protein
VPNIPPDPADADRSSGADALAPIAASAIAAIIDAGVQALIAEPWRVGRIIGGAQHLTIDELDARTARRRRAAPADLNQAIALAQLSRALKSPLFRRAWISWRIGAASEREQASGAAEADPITSETDAAHGDSTSLIA